MASLMSPLPCSSAACASLTSKPMEMSCSSFLEFFAMTEGPIEALLGDEDRPRLVPGDSLYRDDRW